MVLVLAQVLCEGKPFLVFTLRCGFEGQTLGEGKTLLLPPCFTAAMDVLSAKDKAKLG